MTKASLTICAALSLLLSGCAGSAALPPTPAPTDKPAAQCLLTPCPLPGRGPIRANEDWDTSLGTTEDALLKCATQVATCIKVQEASRAAGR
ncbi:Rz1-like lysis system protein LysC [Pseudomonas alloputida]|uniref:Rz1-like lysis system protein LysC n=1 Tax=Pseudomonas alloputida TaxID=1940621 RepID=UPI0039FDE0AF